MAHTNDMGRLGAISFLRAREPVVVASYPVDDRVTTIGRDPDCDIRLYYAEVSSLHAKLVIEDRKACMQPLSIIFAELTLVHMTGLSRCSGPKRCAGG
jgi:hypothetical protein